MAALKEDKKELLLRTALKLFVERGFAGTPTSRIAQEANIATGTLFYFFPTKDQLIHALYGHLKDKAGEYVQKALRKGDSPKAILETYYVESLHWALEYPLEFRFLAQYTHSPYGNPVDPAVEPEKDHPILAHIEEAIKRREILALDPDVLYTLLTSQVMGVNQLLLSKTLTSLQQQELIQTTFELFWKMVCI
jgi:AcrR family transcriptional regulator